MMVPLVDLWLPIVLSAVIVWIASALIWTLLPFHKSDYHGFPDEDAVRNAMQPQNLAPGMYDIPHLTSMSEMKDPAIVKKFEDGPAGFFTVVPRGMPPMGKAMAFSVIYYIIVSAIVAYVASRTTVAGAEYLAVFRITGCVAWLAYGAAVIPDAIWFGRPWRYVAKLQMDALIYGLLTAGVFGWLWPS